MVRFYINELNIEKEIQEIMLNRKENFIVLLGGSHCEKADLLNHLCETFKNNSPPKSSLKITCKSLISNFLNNFHTGKENETLKFLITQDLLIIDDINYSKGKEYTQKMIGGFIAGLLNRGKVVIIASDDCLGLNYLFDKVKELRK